MQVPVYDHGVVTCHALIDDEDAELVLAKRWRLEHGYAVSGKFGLRMHRLVMGNPQMVHEVDHKDRDPLNNHKSNLRLVTRKINAQNISAHNGQRGVCWDKERGKWRGYAKVDGKHIYKRFDTEQEASDYAKSLREQHFSGALD